MSELPELLDPGRADPCPDHSHTHILVVYAAPQGRPDAEGSSIPFRCGRADDAGRSGWGFRHFAVRWRGRGVAVRFHADIATTLERGRRRRIDRGTVRYDLAWPDGRGDVERAMTVVVSLRSQQPDLGIRGIATAYWWERPRRAAALLPCP